MLKFCFYLLLAANAALFAYGHGYLGHFDSEEHEPDRLKNQLNTGLLRVLPAQGAGAPNPPATSPAPVGVRGPVRASAPGTKEATVACIEVGNFSLSDARRFEAQVATLELGDRQARRVVQGQEVSSYMVMIPPQASRDAAEKKAAELKAKDVTNFYIIPDSEPQKWGISLGVFKAEAAAQAQLAALVKQGVHTARIAPRYSPGKQTLFQFRDIGAATRARLQGIAAKFPEQQVRKCQ